MLRTGDIVLERNLENKKDNMFVVLFNFWLSDKECACICPITNTKKPKYNTKSFLKNYVYIPYEILNDRKMCSVKINRTPIYKVNELTQTGLSLRPEVMLRIFNSIMDLNLERPSLSKEHYEYVKEAITFISEDIKNNEKNRIKEEKKLRKLKRKELKRNYDNIKNK